MSSDSEDNASATRKPKRARCGRDDGPTPRRDTSLKYHDDLTDHPDAQIPNLTTVLNTLGWTKAEGEEACEVVSTWWREHPESKPLWLRADRDKARLAGLIEHLSARYRADLEGKAPVLVEKLLVALPQRVLQRERRRIAQAASKKRSLQSIEDEATDDAGDSDPLAPATPPDGRMQAPPPPSRARGDLFLQLQRTDEAGTFVCLARRIVHPSGSAGDAADILQRLSLDKLQDYLKVKTGLSVNFDLSTQLDSDTVDITDDDELVAMAVHAADNHPARLKLSCRPQFTPPPPSSPSTATEAITSPPPSSFPSTATESPSTPPPKRQKIESAAPDNSPLTPDRPVQDHRSHPLLDRPSVLPPRPQATRTPDPSSFTPVNPRPQHPSCRTPRDGTLPFNPAAPTAFSSEVTTGHDSDLRPRSLWDRMLDRTLAATPQPHRLDTDLTDHAQAIGASAVRDAVPPQMVNVEMDWGLPEGPPAGRIFDAPKDPGCAVASDTAAEPTLEEARPPNPAVDVARDDPRTPPKEADSRDDDHSRFDEPKPRSLNVGPDHHPGAKGEPTVKDVATGSSGGKHDDAGRTDDEVVFLGQKALDDNVITYGPAVRQGLDLPEPPKIGDGDADGEGGVDGDDPDLAQRLGNVAVHVTDHINDPGRWQDCCRFFGLDPADRSTAAVTKFRGLRLPFLPYQVFGIFVMYEMEMFQNGGFLADEMGLGKTAESFGLLALNRSLLLCRREVRASREGPDAPPHLPTGSQSADARCPQGFKYGFECYCLDRSYAHRFEPTRGPNLAVVPAAVIRNWEAEVGKWIDPADPVFGRWEVRIAHGGPGPLPGLAADDAPLLAHRSRASAVLVVTTPGCLKAHVTQPHAAVAWARVIVDEAHLNSGPGTQLVKRIHAMTAARKWFLSGTPVESGPKQLAGWISTLQTDAWSNPKPTAPAWPRREEYQASLAACTQSALKKLGSAHEGLIRKQVAVGSQEVSDHVRKMSAVLKTLYLKRSATESLWFGKPLTEVPVNHHQEICIRLAPRLVALVDGDMARINEAVLHEYQTRLDAHNASRKRGLVEEPKVNMQTFFLRARRAKIVTSYPMLAALPATKDLDYTQAEMVSLDCMSVKAGHLYTHAVRETCPYNANITAICARRNCPKIRVLDQLLKGWPKGEKAVICASSPVSAYILYLYLRRKHSKRVALFTQKFDKHTLHKIVQAFHGQPEALAKSSEQEGPQYIVGTTKLIGIGIDLTAAVRLIQFEPEWNERDHAQARKRINRIGQASETHTYALHTTNGKVEHMIFDRHARRLYMNDLALKPDQFADATFSTFDGLLAAEGEEPDNDEGPVA